MVVLEGRNMYEQVEVIFECKFQNSIKFNKECICWCMDFIDIKMLGKTIKKTRILD